MLLILILITKLLWKWKSLEPGNKLVRSPKNLPLSSETSMVPCLSTNRSLDSATSSPLVSPHQICCRSVLKESFLGVLFSSLCFTWHSLEHYLVWSSWVWITHSWSILPVTRSVESFYCQSIIMRKRLIPESKSGLINTHLSIMIPWSNWCHI